MPPSTTGVDVPHLGFEWISQGQDLGGHRQLRLRDWDVALDLEHQGLSILGAQTGEQHMAHWFIPSDPTRRHMR